MNPPNPQGLPHPPRPFYEHPITFVRSETQGEVHVFLPDSFDLEFVREIANNFRYRHWFGANENAHEIDNVSSHSVQQQVLVYHDSDRNKFRLCPGSNGLILEGGQTGQFVLLCDMIDPNRPQGLGRLLEPSTETSNDARQKQPDQRIPRPRNSWILYRQAKSKDLSKGYPGKTASELSTLISKMWHEAPQEERDSWQLRAKEEDRLHKEMYPWYKYTTRK